MRGKLSRTKKMFQIETRLLVPGRIRRQFKQDEDTLRRNGESWEKTDNTINEATQEEHEKLEEDNNNGEAKELNK